jgi:hypothetical protein
MTDATFKTRAAAFWAELKQLETKYGVELTNGVSGPVVNNTRPNPQKVGSTYIYDPTCAPLKSKGVEP